MRTKRVIENLVSKELKSLCHQCVFVETCGYHQRTTKVIIQCEMYTSTPEELQSESVAGLCKSCELKSTCTLPARKVGAWHCPTYQ